MNYKQDNWMALLLLAQFVYNTSVAKNIKILLAYVIYRFNPEVYRSAIISEINNQVTII
jgi:hypothetical protein